MRDKLIAEGVMTSEQVEALRRRTPRGLEQARVQRGCRSSRSLAAADRGYPRRATTPPSPEQMRALAQRISSVPDGYELHPLVNKMMNARRDMASGKKPLDWGMGEHLAFASLLDAGIDVRLSGQDSARGTFNHRHAVLHNQKRDEPCRRRVTFRSITFATRRAASR